MTLGEFKAFIEGIDILDGEAPNLYQWRRIKEKLDTLELRDFSADKIEGLEADLESAVETAFTRGATEWTRLNYPKMYERLSRQVNNT